MSEPSPIAAARAFVLAAAAILGLAAPVTAQPDPVAVLAAVSADGVGPGGRLMVAVVLDHEPHFHTWPAAAQDVLPPDIAGFAVRTTIDLAEAPAWAAAVGDVQWPDPSPAPVPNLVTGEGTMEVPTYQGRAVAFIPILVAKDAPEGEASLRVKVGYQACDDTMCYRPEEKTIRVATAIVAQPDPVESIVGDFLEADWGVFEELAASVAAARPQPDPSAADQPVTVSARPWSRQVAPGSQTVVAVILDHAEHMHTWPAKAQDVLPPDLASFAINTDVALADPPAWLSLAQPIQWPRPSEAAVPSATGEGSAQAPVYQGRAVAYVAVSIAEEAPAGPAEVRLRVTYQACDEAVCYMPEDVTVTVPLVIQPGAGPAPEEGGADAIFDGFKGFAAPRAEPAPGGGETDGGAGGVDEPAEAFGPAFFGLRLPAPNTAIGMLVVLLASMAGGFVLNLTPCVLPVIPIKIMTLSQHGGDRARTLALGVWMALGVVAFWVGIGIPAALLAGFTDPSQIFGIWWVTFGIGALIAIMALGLFGAFALNLPKAVYAVNPKADTPAGSFLYGVMTGVLGLPCFGFVAGALLTGAALLPAWLVIAIFGGIGVGMAAPYLVLAMKPALIERIPRTGPASELVKQVMALLLLAAAAFFIGSGLIALVSERPWMGPMLHWWAVAIFAVAAGLWLVVRTFQISGKPASRVVFTALAALVVGVATLYAVSATESARDTWQMRQVALEQQRGGGEGQLLTTTWIDYTPELFDRARKEGYIVVMDFTAEWCLICKSLKAGVLNREPVKSALTSGRVVSMTVDLTSIKAPGWQTLRDLGQRGIPTLAIYTPGDDTPWIANNYTRQQVVEALARAGAEIDSGSTSAAAPAALRPAGGS